LNAADKFVVRKSILELAKNGRPRSNSIDHEIRCNYKEGFSEGNLWDYVTALGAQVSRPPYDPYRETISLDTPIGRRSNRIVLKMPLLIYDSREIPQASETALDIALNRLAENGITLGLISQNQIANRKYPLFQKIHQPLRYYCSDGLVLKYNGAESIRYVEKIRTEFGGPILVEVDDAFAGYSGELMDVGADGFLADTVKMTKGDRYKGKHAMAVIREARVAIDKYYKGKENDGTCLVVAGDINNSGNIMKAVALGADVIGYSASLLIANAGIHSVNPSDSIVVAERIYNHIMGTKGEIKGVVGALGYSDFRNLSPSDLRTSSIRASLQGNIPLEGIDRSYSEIIEEILDDIIKDENLEIEETEKHAVIEALVGEW